MRKGYTFVEMMAIMILLPVVILVLNGLFRTLVRDIPQASRVVQENTTVLDVLEQIQQDVDRAKGLPQSSAGYTADNEVLLIELADGTICYELKDGKVLRRNLADNAKGATAWSVPNAQVQWEVWRKDGTGYAVEIQTHVKQKFRNRRLEKMAASRLYFVGAL